MLRTPAKLMPMCCGEISEMFTRFDQTSIVAHEERLPRYDMFRALREFRTLSKGSIRRSMRRGDRFGARLNCARVPPARWDPLTPEVSQIFFRIFQSQRANRVCAGARALAPCVVTNASEARHLSDRSISASVEPRAAESRVSVDDMKWLRRPPHSIA